MGKLKDDKLKLIIAVAMLPFLFLSAQAFGQSINASLSGTVMDASQAVLPGATVVATNNDTGVKATTSTNSAGAYNFASLPPGVYKVTAEMPGFQTTIKTDVRLGTSAQIRVNFELAVAGVATQIEISTTAQDMLLESSSTTGTVMEEKTVTALPLLGNDMMELINVMGGVVRQENTIFGNSDQTFAGVAGPNVNLQRDGITVNDVRFVSGIVSPGRINPEMVGEFKLVLSPVDAEMGRGAGQVQVLTKSGANAFHGSGLWSVMNTALDANEWANNRNTPVTPPNWRNVNEYTISVGGPIKKNKTFFFAVWDQNIVRQRQTIRTPVLTPCARKGIYRYFPGWINGNTQTAINRTAGTQTRPVVDQAGNPLTPTDNYDGTAYSGALQYYSVLGQLTSTAQSQLAADPINCSQFNFSASNAGVVAGTNWDQYRKAYDQSGYIDRFSAMMPQANDYYIGDGLNVADLQWIRTTPGQDTVFGTGEDNARKSINIKIDHNLSERHRLSGTYSYESSFSSDAMPTWPNGYGGAIDRKPQTFTVNFTSTLKPTLLNEFRFGLAYNISHTQEPLSNAKTKDKMADLLQQLMPTSNWANWKGLPVVIGPGAGATSFVPDTWSIFFATSASNPYGSMGNLPSTWGDNDWRWTYADTLTWTKGSHSFKGGTEVRLTQANMDFNGWGQFFYSSNTFPYVQGGNTVNSQPAGLTAAGWPGMVGLDLGNYSSGSYGGAYNLMSYMAGSVGVIRQWYFANSASQKTWNDAAAGELTRNIDGRQRELSLFFKDDWKVNSSLTLNLGLRYDYYGVPWIASGMTAGLVGGPLSIFGGSTGGFSTWLQNPAFDPNNLTVQQFIGPNSPNPDLRIYDKDLNNFGPAVGFAWQLPWLGKGKTTLRGGYQMSYIPIDTSDPNAGYGLVVANVPGLIYPHEYAGDTINVKYMDMTMLQQFIPTKQYIDPSIQPLQVRPVTDRSQSITVYDPFVRSPYIQSLTMALTRNIGSNLTVDVRYIGTLSRKMIGTQALNAANWINNGLAAAFDQARAGQESDLLNTLIPSGTLQRGTVSGAAQLRANASTRTYLATGNYNALAGFLATTNGTVASASGVRGNLLRNSGTPENFIYTNPQFSAANWRANLNHNNYHSMQTQVTLRPTQGLSLQAAYTWSRNLGMLANTDPLDRAADYGILGSNRSHSLSTYGTYNLPLGANGLLFRNSSGAVKKIVEGWQVSWISSLTSGLPASVTTLASMWGGSGVDLVNPALFDTKGGQVDFPDGAWQGTYYGNKYVQVTDPQCNGVDASIRSFCTSNLHALALASDPTQIVFQHAKAGVRGNFDPNSITGPGRWSLDMAISKNVEFMEGKSINLRIDANNIFNHPTPSGTAATTYNQRQYTVSLPTFDLNSTNPFGYVGYKGGHRVFSAKLRISF